MEARKLDNRTRLTFAEAPVTLNYGAILDEIVENGETVEFMYLGEPYSCKSEVTLAVSVPLGERQPAVEAQAARPNAAAEPPHSYGSPCVPGRFAPNMPNRAAAG